jgi:hypothetical protein
MATAGEEELEYESDPEEVKRSLAMRRREASDDEEGEGVGREKPRIDRRVGTHSDESDDQGGVAEYEDDEELDEEEEEEEEDEEDEEREPALDRVDVEEEEVYVERGGEGEARVGGGVKDSAVAIVNVNETVGATDNSVAVQAEDQDEGEEVEEKKENEPFAVPTAGAFYMHDDRFRDNAGGRPRYILVLGSYLWRRHDIYNLQECV